MSLNNDGSKSSAEAPPPDSVSSPQSRKVAAPWTQIVRGESPPLIVTVAASASPSSPPMKTAEQVPTPATVEDTGGEGGGYDGNVGKRPVWKKPASEAVEVGAVMGAVSWPALSDARAPPTKTSSSESPRGPADGLTSLSITQGIGAMSMSSPKQVNSSWSPTNNGPTRHRSMKQRNNASASSNGGVSHHQTPAGQGVEVTLNPSPKEQGHRSSYVSQTHSSNDHPQQPHNSFRNRNGGSHPRGDVSHHPNFSGRHQDRGSQDPNYSRNFNGRDSSMPPQRLAPRGVRPSYQPPASPSPNPYITPLMRPFGAPIGYSDFPGQVMYPFLPPHDPTLLYMGIPPPHFSFVRPDLQLHDKIITQIEYYFSNDNLIKDTFLRHSMDDQGWVSVKLISGFKKVMFLTENIQIILEALRSSNVVEVDGQGEHIRRRNDWKKWIMPSAQPSPVSTSRTPDFSLASNYS